jgi:hypothetical protein
VVLQRKQLRPAKVLAAKPSNVDTYSALVCQHTTQMLLPQVDERIDDLQYENYNVPALMYGHRMLIARSHNVNSTIGVREFTEDDYVDARVKKTYAFAQHKFRAITDADELHRLHVLNVQMKSIVNNKNVSDRHVQSALTAQQYAEYVESLTTQAHSAEIMYGDGMPSELRGYNKILHAADFQNNKFEKMSVLKSTGRKNYSKQSVTAASNKAESLYEDARERLVEIWSSATPAELYELQTWMDRDIDINRGFESTISIDCIGMPRVRGSRSSHAMDTGLPKLSKRIKRRECQLIAICAAACAIAFEPEAEEDGAVSAEDADKLRERLKNLLSKNKQY